MRHKNSQSGYTLIETVVVLIIVSFLAAIFVSQVYMKKTEAGGGERVIAEVVSALQSKKNEARRLSGNDRRLDLTNQISYPVEIDFNNLSTTASLRVDGTDEDGDCRDDVTGMQLTCLTQLGESEPFVWKYSYLDDALKLPANWNLVKSPKQLGPVPLIFDGENGRGVMASKIGFTPQGRAVAFNPVTGQWDDYPEGSVASEHPSLEESPFWAIYFNETGQEISLGRGRMVSSPTIAIAVHPTGLIERFRYDPQVGWIGYNNR
jgi:prepilin-type N-terminal cleavage/methylation domain-containing protein